MIGYKEKALKNLIKRGFNVHSYIVPRTLDELFDFVECNNKFSIRFDSAMEIPCLPFYIFDSVDYGKLVEIWEEAESINCNCIVSNGHMFEDALDYNIVAIVNSKGDFEAEACEKKCALRDMYREKCLNASGNIFGDVEFYNFGRLSRKNVCDTVFWLYQNGIFNRYVEMSVYSENVGVNNEKYVVWQL